MVEDSAYCINVLQQSSAVQSAIKKVDQLILEHHIRTCVTKAIKKDSGEEVIKEILEVFSKR
ncbi:MAG: metal-sensing transcriptional repressor [Patescibacteria group bacterium]|nr:metal-sensing transcriptional repressor [Patescibacteria group bacterium]